MLTGLAWLGVAALPCRIGVGILKYRLYEIDRIISRTLAYAIVTGLLVGVYAGLVLLTTQVFRVHTPVAVAVSTLAAAALFNPCGDGCSVPWTGGSTGPVMRPDRGRVRGAAERRRRPGLGPR